MYNIWFVAEIEKQRHHELLQAAEHERTLQALRTQRPPWPMRIRLGLADGLIALGQYLQAHSRGAAVTSIPTRRASNH
jgi:hypothetical protein